MSLGIRAGPAAFDVVHAEGVEPFGDPQLVRDREGDAFALRPVAEGRVVDFDVSHLRPIIHCIGRSRVRLKADTTYRRVSASADPAMS